MHRFKIPGRRTLVGVAAACVAALALGGSALAEEWDHYTPPFEGHSRWYYKITAKHSGLNLNVGGASTQNGAEVGQWKHDGAMHEQWELVGFRYTDLSQMIRNRWSRQCLTSDSAVEGAPVVQRPCTGATNQRWRFNQYADSNETGWGSYTNVAHSLDLNIAGGSGEYGAKLIQYRHVKLAPNAMFYKTGHDVMD